MLGASELGITTMQEDTLGIELGEMPFHSTRGHHVGTSFSAKEIEVDKAKVQVIEKLLSPTTIKGVHNFLRHVRFYR